MNHKGNAIISVLLGSALLAITALGFSTLFKDVFKFTFQVQQIVDMTQKNLELNALLNNPFSCTTALKGLTLQPNQNLEIASPSGSGSFLRKGTTTVKGVDIKKIAWKSVNVDPTNNENAVGNLEIEYQPQGGVAQTTKEFVVFLKRNPATNSVVSCVGQNTYVRGGIYGNCEIVQNANFVTTQRGPALWPVTNCDHPPTCAEGFSPTMVSIHQGNTTASGTPHGANDVYWISDACVKN